MTATLDSAATQAATRLTQATVSTEFRMQWRSQIMKDHSLPFMEADQIISDTLSFLTVCATYPNTGFRPSKKVDIGWHQFILNTKPYAEFCQRVAGHFIHHIPDEFTAPRRERASVQEALAPTVKAITDAGLPFHPDLWLSDTGSCSQCHDGCTDCGQGGGFH
ncbi:glycine-rich domain-containing protein [Lentzea sp. NEAU-D7]|uniref:glycine-rich domain-containing protein n=1 Tax=Lentzea sp. NEAU-D7 TaxID=2994667 RepID=UPI00224B9BE5|nr:hypothetical protein [Lentzea sp. NEAU-D7]MCX2949972.1 hypothetical protein [Lentzea sp. NEAU-D7]